ncbi:Ku protein (plasmid) [Legionella adelaidensis]|uniref:Non-homologous end joining protein Ku n=1 Tax=Legionella adelaidensis TaxID=45056 RepID=A0A0W0R1V0_9GAMM|nr:Ku protein [Legionella adelaidensis]KTC65071.1 putative DNA repair protein YkoV [Legionella adelaidensis]VEH85410.1 Ku protein [Legionella adelaidensis]
MRAIWSGAITFGLVNIPIKIYSATESHSLNFDLLRRKDLCPVKYARVCSTDGKEVEWEDIAKGYEYREGDYVVLEKDDFEKASPEKTHTIDITQFANEQEVDSIFYETPYYLEPQKEGQKAYALLREALKESKMIGIGEFVLRNHESLVVLKPYGDLILLNKLRYNDEVRDTKHLSLAKAELINPKELKMAMQLINQLSESFKPKEFKDTYIADLKKIIEAKAKGKKVKKGKYLSDRGKVTDIMDLLKKSLKPEKKTKRA